MMPDVLAGERYAIGGAISQVVLQAAMVAGFAAGGALLLVATPRQLLVLDAATFLLSAVLVRRVPHGRERVSVELEGRVRPLADVRLAARLILGNAQLRPLVLVAWCLSAAAVAPEALAVPYVRQTAAGYGGVGLLLAISPIGNVLAGLMLARLPEHRRLPLLWPLALLATAPLTLCLLRPPFLVAVALVALSGMGTAYHLVAMVRFVTLVAPEVRGRALGIAGTGLAVGQGLATAAAGVLGDLLGPASAIGVAGVVGVAAVALCGRGLQVRAEG
jgi:predicted MFS family arabinose efflux permease